MVKYSCVVPNCIYEGSAQHCFPHDTDRARQWRVLIGNPDLYSKLYEFLRLRLYINAINNI